MLLYKVCSIQKCLSISENFCFWIQVNTAFRKRKQCKIAIGIKSTRSL